MNALVVGLGNPDRGDDAVGPAVAEAVAAGLEATTLEDPTALVELWAGREHVVVVDAVRTGAAPGTVHVLEAGTAPVPDRAWRDSGRAGTHGFGLAAAVELSRALGRLPQRVTVVGVEAARFDHEAPLSAPVAAAVPEAVAVVQELAGQQSALTGTAGDHR